MIRLDDTAIEAWGLAPLAPRDRAELLHAFASDLELAVGRALTDLMTEEQVDAFSRLIDLGDQSAAAGFLDRELPDYRDVVQEQYSRLAQRVADAAPQILRACGVERDVRMAGAGR